jgi:hypothetical protein
MQLGRSEALFAQRAGREADAKWATSRLDGGALDENDVTRSPYLVNASITFKGGRDMLGLSQP